MNKKGEESGSFSRREYVFPALLVVAAWLRASMGPIPDEIWSLGNVGREILRLKTLNVGDAITYLPFNEWWFEAGWVVAIMHHSLLELGGPMLAKAILAGISAVFACLVYFIFKRNLSAAPSAILTAATIILLEGLLIGKSLIIACLAAWIILANYGKKALWTIPLATLIWANSDISYIFAIPVIFAGCMLTGKRLIGVISLGTALITPDTWHLASNPQSFQLLSASSANFHNPQAILTALLCFAGLLGLMLFKSDKNPAEDKFERFLAISMMPFALYSGQNLIIWAVFLLPGLGYLVHWTGIRFSLSAARMALETNILAIVSIVIICIISLPFSVAKQPGFPLADSASNSTTQVVNFIYQNKLSGEIVHPPSCGGYFGYILKKGNGFINIHGLVSPELSMAYKKLSTEYSQIWERLANQLKVRIFVAEQGSEQQFALQNAPMYKPVYKDADWVVFMRQDWKNPELKAVNLPPHPPPDREILRQAWTLDIAFGNYYRAADRLTAYLNSYPDDNDAQAALLDAEQKIAQSEGAR